MRSRRVAMGRTKAFVQKYLDKLELEHPHNKSWRFIKNSYEKWACKEILREIDSSEDIPFELTPAELLEQFGDKMNRYACNTPDKDKAICFVYAADLAEYFLNELFHRTL